MLLLEACHYHSRALDVWPLALTLSVAGFVEPARSCSISGAAKADTSSDRPQFLNAKVPVADSSKEVGLMILHILLWPENRQTHKILCVQWCSTAKTLQMRLNDGKQNQKHVVGTALRPCVSQQWWGQSGRLYPYKRHPLNTLQLPTAGTRPLPPEEVPLEPPGLQLMWQRCCSFCPHSTHTPGIAHKKHKGTNQHIRSLEAWREDDYFVQIRNVQKPSTEFKNMDKHTANVLERWV